MIYVSWSILAIASVNFLVSLINLLSFHFLPEGSIGEAPLVSVLIPARNEEANIGNILTDLLMIPYRNLEVLVFNDESTDHTEQIVQKFEKKDGRFRLLTGSPLPPLYTGKNHACHQLSMEATGEYFLFLDADVRLKETLIESALSWMIKKELALLSIFPLQVMKTVGEKLSVPLMNWILLSLLPMPLIRQNKRASLAAANGQFMLFPAEIYRKFQFHQLFREHKIEDMAIIRYLKKKGKHVDTFLGKDNISCRMYDRLGSAIEGFSKNIFLFFGNSITLTLLYAILITLAPVFIVLYLPATCWIIYAILILGMRVNISLASRQDVFQNLLYLVPQQIVLLFIIIKALHNRITGKLIWKDRNILDI